MGHMKKSWGKTIKTILGVLVGNLVLSFAVAAFTVPNGIIMGGATGIGLTISHYFPVNLSLIIWQSMRCCSFSVQYFWERSLH